MFQLLARHTELEQSETKAQAALVTILSLTQITELKLLLDIGRYGHRFYDFVLTLLVACISLEIFVGIIIIYIGNLHYYQAAAKVVWCYSAFSCFSCFCHNCPLHHKHSGAYESVHETVVTSSQNPKHPSLAGAAGEDAVTGCCDWPLDQQMETIIDLERADCHLESARVKVADAEMKIVRATNYVRVVEDAFKKTPGNSDLEEELVRARETLAAAMREREEGEAEQKLAEAQQRHACNVKEHHEDRRERLTFRKVSFWQHMATYLLYFVMLMNVFITTFGISGGTPHSISVSHTAVTRGSSTAVFSAATLANVVTMNSTHSG